MKRRRTTMKNSSKLSGGRRGLAVLAACLLAGSMPFTAFAAKSPNNNMPDTEAPAPDINKDLSPEFAYSQDKWAALKDNVMEYGELADLIHEYNPIVRSNRESYNDMKGKTLNDVYQEVMDDVDKIWAGADTDNDVAMARTNMSASLLQQQADNLYEDPEMQKLKYGQTEASLVSQAQQLMAAYEQSRYTMENLNSTRDLLQEQYNAAAARQAAQVATQTDVLNALKKVQDQDAAILSAQKSADNVHRSLCLMLGWQADSQPEIRDLPEPDMSRIGSMNPEADLITALANNYDIRYYEKKAGNLTSDALIESTKATVQDTKNTVTNALKTNYDKVLTTRDTLGTDQAQLQLATVNLNTAAAKLASGSAAKLDYMAAENQFLTAKNAVETTKLQLQLAIESYDWIVKGLTSN